MEAIWVFKSLNMARELEIAGEFIYESAQKMMQLSNICNNCDVNTVLYAGSVGIERLQKIYLCIALPNPLEKQEHSDCLLKHNHLDLEAHINAVSGLKLDENGKGLLGLFSSYYNNFRYANYKPGTQGEDLSLLFAGFLKRINKKYDYKKMIASSEFEKFKKFYINVLGATALHYYKLINEKSREIGTFTYEIRSDSYASRVFWTCSNKLYEQLNIEKIAVKELLLHLYKDTGNVGVFKLLNTLTPIEFDDYMINEYLSDLCNGKINDQLIDWVYETYSDYKKNKQFKERMDDLSLIGNTDVIFDDDE